MALTKNVKLKQTIYNINQYYKNKNKILIVYRAGGLGDMLVHRMIFEDIKLLIPDAHITFACMPKYFDAIKDHPFIDEVIDWELANFDDYMVVYDTTAFCTSHEKAVAPKSTKNRSDLWAQCCGFELTKHDMHLQISDKMKEYGKNKIQENTVLIAPISAMTSKSLLTEQYQELTDYIKQKNFNVIGIHSKPIDNLETIYNISIKEWLGIIWAAKYIISVDTSVFHAAGGLNKPVLGIFTWADGLVYSKYYSKSTIVQLHRETHPHWTCGPCYDFPNCPKTKNKLKPCLTELTIDMLIDGFNKMIGNYNGSISTA